MVSSMPAAKRKARRIASERMKMLLKMARENIKENPDLAQRYTDLAREFGMRFKLRIPQEYRSLICRHCKSFILPGVNCRVRLQRRREPHIVITCLNCGGHMRIPFTRNESKDRNEETKYQ
jgi:ribonuclease P protein subunit RPR2